MPRLLYKCIVFRMNSPILFSKHLCFKGSVPCQGTRSGCWVVHCTTRWRCRATIPFLPAKQLSKGSCPSFEEVGLPVQAARCRDRMIPGIPPEWKGRNRTAGAKWYHAARGSGERIRSCSSSHRSIHGTPVERAVQQPPHRSSLLPPSNEFGVPTNGGFGCTRPIRGHACCWTDCGRLLTPGKKFRETYVLVGKRGLNDSRVTAWTDAASRFTFRI